MGTGGTGRRARGVRAWAATAAVVSVTMLAGCASQGRSGTQAAATRPPAGSTTALASTARTGPAAATVSAANAAQVTRRVTLAPVDRRGQPVRGWTVDRSAEDPDAAIDCGDIRQAYPSPAAVSGDIYYCSPSAAGADACWPTPQPRRMLCLRDPERTTLTALTAQALVAKVSPPRNPAPLGLVLANGDHCRLRNGGAWISPEHRPDLVGYYSCGPRDIVWAHPDSPAGGVDRTTPRWTVLIGDVTGPLTTVAVTEAEFVTSAR